MKKRMDKRFDQSYMGNLQKLYGKSAGQKTGNSKCCNAGVDTVNTDARNYYVCQHCHKWCDLNV